MKRLAASFLGLALCLLASTSCTTVSQTGRSQLILISAEQEMQLGFTTFQQMKKEMPISDNAQANAMLQTVGSRIAAVAELEGAEWEFVLFEDDQPNAFCLPGGKVGVFTGILPITRNEAGLATVIGHEVAHATARHGAERVSEQMVMQGLGSAIGAGASALDADPQVQAIVNVGYGVASQLGRALPHSRQQELEADYIGLLYMAQSGYDPAAAVDFWQRFAAYNEKAGGEPAWFLSTHPLSSQRLEKIKEWIPEVRPIYEQNR